MDPTLLTRDTARLYKRVISRITSASRTGRLTQMLSGSLIIGLLMAIKTISLGSLVYSGALAQFAPRGIGMALLGGMVISIVTALFSSLRGMIASPQEAPVAILALIATLVITALPSTTSPEQAFATVLAASILASVLSGLFFLALGSARLGGLVRYVPYPVLGGFMAATGWLLVKGAIGLMAGVSLDNAPFATLFSVDVLARWLPGVLFAIYLFIATQRSRHFLVMPATIAAGIALFYVALAISSTSIADAGQRGWLLGPFSAGNLWQPLDFGLVTKVDWSAILSNTGTLVSVLITGVSALLLNASGIELAVEQDVHLNRELRTAGAGNLLSALTGGLVGFQSLSLSTMAHKLGVRNRSAAILAALISAIPLVISASALSYLPKAVLGGLLAMLGLAFLVEWLVRSWSRLRRLDYLVVVLIVVASAATGFLNGVAVGVIAAVVLFAIDYSRVSVVKHILTGANRHSSYTRNKLERQLLNAEGDQLLIIQLQGFIFFGTSSNLILDIRTRIEQTDARPIRFILLDFRQVSGLDSSALFSFDKLRQLALARHITLVLTQLSAAIQGQLAHIGVIPKGTAGAEQTEGMICAFSDLDHGIEWCEERIIQAGGGAVDSAQITLPEQLLEVLPKPADVVRLLKYLEKLTVAPSHYLLRQGDAPDVLYFVESGRLTAQLDRPGKPPVRLQTMAGQNVVGEIGFYLGTPRTASVVAEAPSTVYRLTQSALARMKQDDPDLAAALHEFIARLMAERVAHLTGMVDVVIR